jgi:hypothetical protein
VIFLDIPNFIYNFKGYLLDMKKLILTENQVKTMTNTLIKESIDDNRYKRDVNIDVESYGVTYKGMEINDISSGYNLTLTYLIEQEHRSWGVKDISLYDIKGPEGIEIEVEYWIDEDNMETGTISLPIDWGNIETDTQTGHGVVTIGNTLVVSLKNDESGEIVIDSFHLEVYTL